jgi:penicillin V acylase-like amidase (Ntn superfamily)
LILSEKLKAFRYKKHLAVLLIICTICIATISIIFINCNPTLNDNERLTLSSLEKVDDYPLFFMIYYGDYGFEEYLRKGIEIATHNIIQYNYACTCFVTLENSSDMLFGRNFDWYYSPALILFTNPSEGYASVSMVDLDMLGFSEDSQSSITVTESLQELLNAPYYVLDGMNEHGLTIGCMAVPSADCELNSSRITLDSLTMMRLALDCAQNVEETIDLWKNYNVYFPPGPPVHYLVADAKGNSAVIEWINGEMKVINNDKAWQISTNFVIYGSNELNKESCRRYSECSEVLSESNGVISEKEAINLLSKTSQSSTQWSTVYNMHTGEIRVIVGRRYENPIHIFTLS